MKIEDVKEGDIIQRKGTDELWLVEYVFPEKIVAKRTIDVMAAELEGFKRFNDYGSTVREARKPLPVSYVGVLHDGRIAMSRLDADGKTTEWEVPIESGDG